MGIPLSDHKEGRVMKGWQIVKHSMRQVFGNMNGALQVSAVLFLAQYAIGLVLGVGMMSMAPGQGMGMGFGVSALVVLVVVVITGLWIAVAWHRYVLLGEDAGFMPKFLGPQIWAYFLRGLAYGLILVVIGGIWGAIVGAALGSMMMGNFMGWMIAMAVFVQLPIVVIAFRLSTDLPSAALGAGHAFFSGWQATKGQTMDIAVMAVILVGLNLAANILGFMVFGFIPVINLVWNLVIGWLQMMISVSVLTTLYGHYIEKRELV